jgi:hypothetical protein
VVGARRRVALGGALLGAAAAAVPPAAAQTSRDSAALPQPFCIRGRPRPRCANFLLYELSAHANTATTTQRGAYGGPFANGATFRRDDFRNEVGLAVGAMHNRDARTALGGAAVLSVGGGDPTVGVVGRWRRWTGPNTSLELAAGPVRVDVPAARYPLDETGGSRVRRPGLLTEARANLGDIVAGSVRVTLVPRADGRTRAGVSVGGALGSRAAAVGTVGVAVFFGLLFYALSGVYT